MGEGTQQFRDEVFPAELRVLRARREALRNGAPGEALPLAAIPDDATKPAVSLGLVGLALSGGGIRSATFNLGLLQGLHRAGLLSYIDYLSTVSGGGYIGACFSALTRHPGRAFPFGEEVEDDGEAALLRLRNTTPRFVAPDGVLDFLSIPIVMVRGAIGNLFKIFPYAALLAFLMFAFLRYHTWFTHLLDPSHVEIADWARHCDQMHWYSYIFLAEGIAFVSAVWILFGKLPIWFTSGRLGLRRLLDRSFAAVIILTIGTAFLEAQPVVLCALDATHIHRHIRDHNTLAVLLVAVAMALATALLRTRNLLRPLALLLSLILGVGLTYLLLLFLTHELAFGEVRGYRWQNLAIAWAVVSAVLMALSRVLADVNNSSMFGFYRDHLSATFMLQFHPNGGLDVDDSLTLAELCTEGSSTPYHLFNATLNLQGSNDPSLRGRRAGLFMFSKLYVGGDRTGYCRSHDLGRVLPNINVGTAMAISAAAASPNMGTYTVGPAVMLMTLLNVRMGYWMPNPRHFRQWMQRAWLARQLDRKGFAGGLLRLFARFRWTAGNNYYLRELLSQLDDEAPRINVSDGGHIENSAIYELLRRRCKYIIAGDAEADPKYHFGGLATLVRLARLDLGVEIDIDVSSLDPNRATSHRHAVLARVRYPEGDRGLLLYVKARVTGDEDELIKQYQAEHPDFPQQPTSDQFFSEDQFEAYRTLGLHSIASVGEEPTYAGIEAWFRALGADTIIRRPESINP